jgi:hypothetical protein
LEPIWETDMIDLKHAVNAWDALQKANVKPIENETEYQAMLEFLRELMRTQNVEHEPFKSLWATAAAYAADWEAQHDPWVVETLAT